MNGVDEETIPFRPRKTLLGGFGGGSNAEARGGEYVAYACASMHLPDNMSDLDMSESTADSVRRKCKIICTMGPSCWDVDKLVTLIDCGMNICRLNFSHGDHAGHGACVDRIRKASEQRPEKQPAILLDTKGPEIRTGFFEESCGGKITLKAGQELKLVTDYSFKGNDKCIAVTYAKIGTAVKPGGKILIADGSLVLKVKTCASDHVITEVMNDCKIGERKNCNLPGVKVDLPVLQEKDIEDIVNFGIPQGVDFVAASFVQSEEDVETIRETLGEAGKSIKIISKIENQEGLANFDEICEASDGIMVARGDLGMEIPPEKVFMAQKVMIAKSNILGKPVVTATQMLESMTSAPRPTRAEAGDVANAVLDGTDCVMLSGETAGGSFPVEAVSFMRRIVQEAESRLDYDSIYLKTRHNVINQCETATSEIETTCSSAVKAAFDVGAALIVVLTKTGSAARVVAKYRPVAPVFMVSTQAQVRRQSNCLRGTIPIEAKEGLTVDERIMPAVDKAKTLGICQPGDVVVALYGKDGSSNLIKFITVDNAPRIERSCKAGDVSTYGQCSLILPRNMSFIDMTEEDKDSFDRQCKIICTMGPSCWDVDMLVKMIDCGMNIARLNFSHGDHEAHGACVDRIKEADKLRPNAPVGILLDTKGPEIRTGFFEASCGGKVELKKGQSLKLVVDYSFKGNSSCLAVTYAKLPTAVKPGSTILCADGSLVLQVKTCGTDHVMTEVMNDCTIGERKNCNLPGVKVDLPVLQEKDINDIQNFGVPKGVHFVAASFVQSLDDVKFIRETLGEKGKDIRIISKIENQEGLQNFDEICKASDGIMVARGDLGMEIPPEKVFLAQKIMTAKCNLLGKPVVTATQMLESMTKAPRPTRAEAGDVANAVLDGTDCVMLSGETAGGQFPLEAVSMMRRIVRQAESGLDFYGLHERIEGETLKRGQYMAPDEAHAATAVKSALDTGARLIIVGTESGNTARLIAKHRPKATIVALTSSERLARSLLVLRGVRVLVMDTSCDLEELVPSAIAEAQKGGCEGVGKGKPIVLVTEHRAGEKGAAINHKAIKLIHIK